MIKGNSEHNFLEFQFPRGTLFRILSTKDNWRVKRQETKMSTQNIKVRKADVGPRHQHSPLKSLKHVASEAGVPKGTTKTTTKLLKLRSYKTTAVHPLQPRDPVVHFCNRSLQSIHKGKRDPKLTFFFSDEAWFYLNGHMGTQNRRHQNTENPHFTRHSTP